MIDYSNLDWSQAVTANLADLNETKEKMAKKTFEKKEVDLTKYFSLNLAKNEKSGTKVFRILPDQTNPLEFKQKVYFHYIKVGEDWKKLYDPSQNGTITDAVSPLNNAKEALFSHPDKEVRKQGVKYKAKLFYILRGIERGKEHEGVKFWRFPAVSDGTGNMDKIESLMSIYNAAKAGGGAFWNPIAGRDLVIALSKDEQRGFTKVANIIATDEKPLHSDQAQMTAWLTDPIKWEDVYKKYGTEYLRIVSEGGIPVWSKEANGYVAKTEDAASASASAQAPAQTATTAVTSIPSDEEAHVDVDLNDLPF